MNLGIIGYTAQTGIGIMTEEICKHIGVTTQMVAPHDTAKFLPPVAKRNFIYTKAWSPDRKECKDFCRDINAVITVETDWGPNTFGYLKEFNVKIIKIVMFEWFNPNEQSNKYVDLWLCTTRQSFEGLPYSNKVFLQWPVDTDRIKYKERTDKAKIFVHNAGNIGINGRKGTLETLRAFEAVKDPSIKLIVNAQRQLPWAKMIDLCERDPRIDFRIRNVEDFADLYNEGDVLIYCSKIDGQSLVGAEGCAAGMPVITTDAAPMNEYWNKEDFNSKLLVKVNRTEDAHTTNPNAKINIVDIEDFSNKIVWCTQNSMMDISVQNRKIAETKLSWKVWKNKYLEVLSSL